MWQVVFTDIAEDDLQNAFIYISEILKAPVAAENLIIEAEKSIGNLADFPLSCPLVSDEYFATIGVRFLTIKNYLAFYIANDSTKVVTVIRFLYARRDWTALLENPKRENEEDGLSAE